jgi:hypothetical protein
MTVDRQSPHSASSEPNNPQSKDVSGEGPPEAPYVPPPDISLPQPDDPGFILFDEGDQPPTRYSWDQDGPTADSPKFFRGFVIGVISSAILAAVLFFVLTQRQVLVVSSPGIETEPAGPPSVEVPSPSISPELPSAGSAEPVASEAPPDPAGPPPLSSSEDDSNALGATAQTTTEPAADDPVADVPEDVSPRVTDSGEVELAIARRFLSEDRPSASAAAARFLWTAVEKGNGRAQILLAGLYARGEGVNQSCDQARVLLRAAAKKGNDEASQELARIIRNGCA